MRIRAKNDLRFQSGRREERPRAQRPSLFCVLAVVILSSSVALARSNGITSGSMPNGTANCSDAACHSVASSDVFVTITGPTALATGEIATYTIEMMEFIPGGLLVGTGMNLSIDLDGNPEALDPQLEQELDWPPALQVLDGEVTHDPFVNVTGGVRVFSWNVPVQASASEGLMTISAALNSFDQNFNNSGDHWARAELNVTVPEPALSAQQMAAGCTLLALYLSRLGGRKSHTWFSIR